MPIFAKLDLFFTWDKNFRYTHSPIVKWASYAYLAVPLFFHLIKAAQQSPELRPHLEMSRLDILIMENLFFSSILVIVAGVLVKIFCPEKISQYPRIEDYALFVLNVRETILEIQEKELGLNEANSGNEEGLVVNDAVITRKILLKIMAKEVIDRFKQPGTIYQEWTTANRSRPVIRWLIGTLHVFGTCGMVVYLLWAGGYRVEVMRGFL